MKKRICIVTADNILPYQPSILHLYDELTKGGFEVEIISFQSGFIAANTTSEGRTVHYLSLNTQGVKAANFLQNAGNFILKRLSNKVRPFSYRLRLVLPLKVRAIINFLKSRSYDAYIGVDSHGFYPIQALGRQGYFFSLELSPPDPYRPKIKQDALKGILIQSPVRLQHLFPHTAVPVYYIQNAPVYQPSPDAPQRKHLIWAGSILKQFGIFPLLDAVRANPDFVLYLKGGIQPAMREEIQTTYAPEIASGRLVFDTAYIPGDQFLQYLNGFRMGFCFYDWDLLRQDFNYFTAPAGKLYAYFAAGVPVIAPDVEGMNAVREFGAGVLVPNYEPQTILQAVKIIEANFDRYVEGCRAAAAHYSFDRMSAPFVEALKASLNQPF